MLQKLLTLVIVLVIVQGMAWYMPSVGSVYLTQSILILAGLTALVMGGDRLVGGAVGIAHHYGVSPLLVGLTVVAMGTSMPELFVNIIAATRSESGILVANIIGSNISNILLIGGTASIITPLLVGKNTLTKEIPISFGAALILLSMIMGISPGFLSRGEGVILLLLFFGFGWYVYQQFQEQTEMDTQTQHHLNPQELFLAIVLVVGGIGGLYLGGNTLVDAATVMAQAAGWSTVLIGASIVAVGTSVPELVTSVIAAIRRQADLAIGNIIGSNIFNILRIGSITSLIKPVSVPHIVIQDILFLMCVTIMLFLFTHFNTKKSVNRSVGVLFVLLYICYIIFLIWRG